MAEIGGIACTVSRGGTGMSRWSRPYFCRCRHPGIGSGTCLRRGNTMRIVLIVFVGSQFCLDRRRTSCRIIIHSWKLCFRHLAVCTQPRDAICCPNRNLRGWDFTVYESCYARKRGS